MRALGGILTFIALVGFIGGGLFGYLKWRERHWAQVAAVNEAEIRAREGLWQERFHALQEARVEAQARTAALATEAARLDQEILNLESALAQPAALAPEYVPAARDQAAVLRARLAEVRTAHAGSAADEIALTAQLDRLMESRAALDVELYPTAPTLRLPRPDEAATGAAGGP